MAKHIAPQQVPNSNTVTMKEAIASQSVKHKPTPTPTHGIILPTPRPRPPVQIITALLQVAAAALPTRVEYVALDAAIFLEMKMEDADKQAETEVRLKKHRDRLTLLMEMRERLSIQLGLIKLYLDKLELQNGWYRVEIRSPIK